jgi:hypothetical protein
LCCRREAGPGRHPRCGWPGRIRVSRQGAVDHIDLAVTTLVTLLAFTSLVVFAARLGVAAALMAVPA